MSAPCGCQDKTNGYQNKLKTAGVSAAAAAAAAVPAQCPALVHDTVCVQAEVTIDPSVAVGDIESFCVGGAVIGACPGETAPSDSCTFTVSQNICVQIPLTFSADAHAVPTGIVCGTPLPGECAE